MNRANSNTNNGVEEHRVNFYLQIANLCYNTDFEDDIYFWHSLQLVK